MSTDFEIIVGTYEQFLLGYKVKNVDNTYNLERSFATHSHLASIRSVASSKHYLASAGADDIICLYDMRYRIASGRLTHHNDTVNCIMFTPEASHIMTASNDGSIGIVRCGNWELEKHWKTPHKGCAVNTLAIHPTGKLAMSTGGDGILRTWNLVKGRQAYATNLVPKLRNDAKNVTILRWSPDGDKFLFAWNCKIMVYSVETAGLCTEVSLSSKVVCVEFIASDLLAIGHEDGVISFCNIATGSITLSVEAHETRVKSLVHRNNYLVSASSSGEVKLWNYKKKKLNILASANCGARITCLALTEPCPDLVVQEEKAAAEEETTKAKKNIFRMRQEVVIEDEGEEITRSSSDARKKDKKKSLKKRAAETSSTAGEFAAEASKRIKPRNKVEVSKNASDNSSMKKRRKSPDEKSDESPNKKIKRGSAKIIANENAKRAGSDVSKNGDLSTVDVAKKKKKKVNKQDSLQKPAVTVSNKRKLQKEVTDVGAGFRAKTTKKKVSR